jgi:selenocysteine-specific elongation factor
MLLQSEFSNEEIHAAITQLTETRKARVRGDFVVRTEYWEHLRSVALNAIAQHHQKHPSQNGLPLSQLRALFARAQCPPELGEMLVSELLASGYVQTGAAIRSKDHAAHLPDHLVDPCERLQHSLRAKPVDPPSRNELAPDVLRKDALHYLIKTGQAVELNNDLVLSREAYQRAQESIARHLREHLSASVSELRQLLGTGRRVMVPLLEKLDRDGVTTRVGDRRVLAKEKPALKL